MKNKGLHEPYKIFFETLGNRTRWEIVHLLQQRAERTTTIAKKLRYEQSLISHHLKRLETCGFVRCKHNGTERIYQLNKETIWPILKYADKHINRYCKKVCYK